MRSRLSFFRKFSISTSIFSVEIGPVIFFGGFGSFKVFGMLSRIFFFWNALESMYVFLRRNWVNNEIDSISLWASTEIGCPILIFMERSPWVFISDGNFAVRSVSLIFAKR